jgi:antitoxin component of RelBE/YafQ-DinJ toxin-antitoxin module
MVTKERDVILNLSVPRDLKEEFSRIAYDFGANPTILIRMFMKHTIATKQVNLKLNDSLEFEPLDTSNWSSELLEKADELTKRWNNITL